jgi:hypothetical protein
LRFNRVCEVLAFGLAELGDHQHAVRIGGQFETELTDSGIALLRPARKGEKPLRDNGFPTDTDPALTERLRPRTLRIAHLVRASAGENGTNRPQDKDQVPE